MVLIKVLMFSKVADEAPSQCFKVMSSFFALLSLLDDVIPDWDLGVRKEGRKEGGDDCGKSEQKMGFECCCWALAE